MSERVIISGDIDSGKTSLCGLLASEFKQHGWDVAGIITFGIFKAQEKVAFQATDLRSGESRRLAELKNPLPTNKGPLTKRWAFNARSLDWANSILEQSTPCQVLFVDELGPLEFDMGQGLLAGVEAINGGNYCYALIVVRQPLLDRALEHWPDSQVVQVGSKYDIHEQATQLLENLGFPPPTSS
jgi:nucleoside-triphosphatase THEP1